MNILFKVIINSLGRILIKKSFYRKGKNILKS